MLSVNQSQQMQQMKLAQNQGKVQEICQKHLKEIQQTGSTQPNKRNNKNIDITNLSRETMDIMKNRKQPGGNIDSIIKNIVQMKADSKANDTNKAQKAGNNKSQKAKITWQPKVKSGQFLKPGQPWAHFKIERPKNGEQNQQADTKGNEKNNQPQQSQNTKAPDGKGVKGKNPTQQKKKQEEEKKKVKDIGGNMKVMQDNNEYYLIDTGTGKRIKIPEDGDVKADKPMMVKSVPTPPGELKGGSTLMEYKNAGQLGVDSSFDPKKVNQPNYTQNAKKLKNYASNFKTPDKAKKEAA